VRILSIDGGGIRGLIPALVLADLEARTGRRVHELFDLIAGTSTGGILALSLTNGSGGAPPTAADVASLYVSDGPRIFHRSVFDRIRTAEGALDEKYPTSGIATVFAELLPRRPAAGCADAGHGDRLS
jgi:patatin-like phospholipase/acyl hydrolase